MAHFAGMAKVDEPQGDMGEFVAMFGGGAG
jgi:hypothetical protein